VVGAEAPQRAEHRVYLGLLGDEASIGWCSWVVVIGLSCCSMTTHEALSTPGIKSLRSIARRSGADSLTAIQDANQLIL
jgi:hypothetical protein